MAQSIPPLEAGWERRLPAHPRLMLPQKELAAVKAAFAGDEHAELAARIRAEADALLDVPPVKRELTGRRLLTVSREALQRLLLLGFMHQMTGESRYATRAREELLAIAAFTDWHPDHFLDTAEMSAAVAIGYDWTYRALSREDRDTICQALREKGLQPYLERSDDLPRRLNNWNPVCGGGAVLAALVVADRDPALAAQVISTALGGLRNVEECYAPDGVYVEGPAYWDYGTIYLCLLADSLRTALGTTADIENLPGLLASLDFMEAVTSPAGWPFNFADSDWRRRGPEPPTLWLAAHADNGFVRARELSRLNAALARGGKAPPYLPLMLLWDFAPKAAPKTPPLAWSGKGLVPVVAMRTSWEDPDAAFLAIKGGSASINHAHMDVGSFVYEWGGRRWVTDLGKQDYNSLEQAGFDDLFNLKPESRRWSIFRLGPESHNILRFGTESPDVHGAGTLPEFRPRDATARLDLSALYPAAVSAWEREVTLESDGAARVCDRWTTRATAAGGDVAWQFITPANVEVGAGGVTLRQDGRVVDVEVTAAEPFRIEVSSADSLRQPYDVPNPGISRVRFLSRAGAKGEFTVRFVPRARLN